MISRYFTLEQIEHSDTALRLGIDNSLPATLLPTATHTAKCLDQVQDIIGPFSLRISSFYRCLALNRILHSKDTSQHTKAEAVDFTCPGFGSPQDIVEKIEASTISFDQLIFEHTWVHISFSSDPNRPNRRHVLTLMKDGTYAAGLVKDKDNKSK